MKKAEERQRDILRKIDEQLLLYENQRGTGSDAGRTAVRVPVVTATEGECVENVYDRNKLYEEVWAEPVSKVAIKYGVSDVMIHKICKQMNIPVPPRGYWAKKNAGKKVEKARLPAKSDVTVIYGNGSEKKAEEEMEKTHHQALEFLSDEEKKALLGTAEMLQGVNESQKLQSCFEGAQ